MAFNKPRKHYAVSDVFAEMDAMLIVAAEEASNKKKALKELKEGNGKLVQDMYNMVNPNWDEDYQDYKNYVAEARKNITSIERGAKERIEKIKKKQEYIKQQDELIKQLRQENKDALTKSGKVYFNSTQVALEEELKMQEEKLEGRYEKVLEEVEYYTKEDASMDALTAELFGDL